VAALSCLGDRWGASTESEEDVVSELQTRKGGKEGLVWGERRPFFKRFSKVIGILFLISAGFSVILKLAVQKLKRERREKCKATGDSKNP